MGTEVFISHHTASSLHIVEGIVNKLESRGIPCWYAPRDTEGDYAGSIMRAIADCKVFVVILNHPASESVHVLNELNAITERIAKKENVAILPFHVADEEISDEARYYIGRVNWLDAMTPPMYQRVDELVNKIMTLLEKQGVSPRHVQPREQEEAGYALVSRLPEARDNFMGREELIGQIGAEFDAGEHALFLEGIGGIGKSELAKQYYIRNRQDYDHVLFLTYQTDLCGLVCDDNVLNIRGVSRRQEENDREYFLRKLRILQSITDSRTLIIVDNFDVGDDPDLKEFLCGSYRVLFTTRNAHPGRKSLQVESIRDEKVLRAIFESHYGDSVSEEELPLLHRMFELIEYHTYALELIAKQMAASFLGVEEMYEILKKGELNRLSDESVDGRTDSKTAFGHICALFNVFGLSDEEKSILRRLALMGIEGVPAPRFKKWAGLKNFETVNALIKKSWVRKGQGQKLSLHPLVIEVVQAELHPDLNSCHRFLSGLSEYCYWAWYHSYEENMALLPCVQSVLRWAEPFRGENFDLLEPCVVFLWIQGRYDESIACGHKLYNACLRDLGDEDPRTAYAAKTLGGCYYNCRRAEESVPWYHRGLEIMLKKDTEYKMDLAMFCEKSARCCSWAWGRDFAKAEELFGRALAIRGELLEEAKAGKTIPTISPYAGTDYNELQSLYGETLLEMGRMYQLKDDYENALVYNGKYRACILGQENYDQENIAYIDMDHGVCLLHLARAKRREGREEEAARDLQEAVKSLTSALDINRSRHGDLAMDTIDCQEYLADAFALLGQYGEASNGYMAVVTMVEKALGPEDARIGRVKRKMDFTRGFPEEEKPLFL